MNYGNGNDVGAEGAGTQFFHEGGEEWYGRRRRGDNAGVRLLGPPAEPPKPDVLVIVDKAHPPDEELLLHEGRVFSQMDTDLFVAEVPERRTVKQLEKPAFKWKGAKLTFSQWQQMLAFFKWSYATFKAEAMCRLYYHETRREWVILVCNQRMTAGLSVKDELDVAASGELLAAGYMPFGSGHHHCSTGAFQSGTDRADEEKSPGFHFTVGHLDKDLFDLHFRCTFREHHYPVELESFVDFSPIVEQIPPFIRALPGMQDEILKKIRASLSVPEFPEEWKARCIPPSPPAEVDFTPRLLDVTQSRFAAAGGTPIILPHNTTPTPGASRPFGPAPYPYCAREGVATAGAIPAVQQALAQSRFDKSLTPLPVDSALAEPEDIGLYYLANIFNKVLGSFRAPVTPEECARVEAEMEANVMSLHSVVQSNTTEEREVETADDMLEKLELELAYATWRAYPDDVTSLFLTDVLKSPLFGVDRAAVVYKDNGYLFAMPEFQFKCANLREANDELALANLTTRGV